jgi:histidinol dehydrogenase
MKLVAAPARLSTVSSTFDAEFAARLHWSAEQDAAIEQRVADILADVQKRGDAAVLEYTARFDGLSAPNMAALELTQAELMVAYDAIPEAQRQALSAAAARVRQYHEAQKKACGESWSYRDQDGTLLGQKVTPLDRVGIYVPGGKAAYPSSVLMNAIPAHVAGVQRDHHGGAHPAGCQEPAGAGRRLRGRCDPRLHHRRRTGGGRTGLRHGHRAAVDKITGPGNAYVASAKRMCSARWAST